MQSEITSKIEVPIFLERNPPSSALGIAGQQTARLMSIRLQRELTKCACRGIPVSYSRLLASVAVAPDADATLVRMAFERLMDEDGSAARPFLAALAISPERGGRPAAWFFDKARTTGRLAMLSDELEAMAFHARELQQAVLFYRAMSSNSAATRCEGVIQGTNKMLTAKDIMTVNVITVTPDAAVSAVAETLVIQGISGVPVLDEDRLVGIVTEGDLLRRSEIGTDTRPISWWARIFRNKASIAAKYTREHSSRVADVMARNVATVREETPIAEIASLLEQRKIRRVPVTRDGKVVGIVSRANIVRAFAMIANLPRDASSADDETIRQQIRAGLLEQAWPASSANFTVRNGVVTFWGTVDSDAERDATRVLCEHIAGVRNVEDHRMIVGFPTIGI
jgi:CBS domain-containing protein